MRVIPAIDIIGGKCVRLVQGDYSRQVSYENDPVSQAQYFEECGADLVHLVDLEGAKEGKPLNHKLVARIASSLSIPVEIGGGIRSRDHINYYLDNNIKRIIIGTKAVSEDFQSIISEFARFIVAGVDARDGNVALSGWIEQTDITAVSLIKALFAKGIAEFIFTDIATDGMLQGPNLKSLEGLLDEIPGISLIASGGVSAIGDIESLKPLESKGLSGCIIGKAIYEGRIDLKEAVKITR